MIVAPSLFKFKAARALRGNWQTALLVSFFSGILITAYSLAQPGIPQEFLFLSPEDMLNAAVTWAKAIPITNWQLFGVLWVLNALITPMLELGCNHYFVRRLQEEELGFRGLFSRGKWFGKALLLRLCMTVIILAWSLLLIVPGLVAAIRYSMAPYYLAEDPSLTVWEALKKSKDAMQAAKMSYFVLQFSFLGWLFLAYIAQSLLAGMNVILSLVVYLFITEFVNAYMSGANAAFFLLVSNPGVLAPEVRAGTEEPGDKDEEEDGEKDEEE